MSRPRLRGGPVERWFREAMVLTIWEGTCHRQILDGLEVMQRKSAHELLFDSLSATAGPEELAQMRRRVNAHLAVPAEQREAGAENFFQIWRPLPRALSEGMFQ